MVGSSQRFKAENQRKKTDLNKMKEQELLRNQVQSQLKTALIQYLEQKNVQFDLNQWKIRIEYSRNEKFGDYSSPLLMENKNILPDSVDKMNIELISMLAKSNLFSEISFTAPGFLNFRISPKYLMDYVSEFLSNKNLYPQVDQPENIIFEFVSANPTGPLNIVSARAASMGDTICNLLEKIGHKLYREFYVNDYGNQVFLLGVSCLVRLREIKGEAVVLEKEDENISALDLLKGNILPHEGYRGEYIIDIVQSVYNHAERQSFIDSLLAQKRYLELAEHFSQWAVDYNLSGQKKDLLNFGVHFDSFFSERVLHDDGAVLSVLEHLRKSDDVYVENEKTFFCSTKYNDDKDRVILREDGRPTYLLADIAYHKTKIDRGFQRVIDIWGPDHHGYIARLKGALTSLGFSPDNFEIIIAQQVNLISKGEKVKMSKRLGNFQTMNDLVDYLGPHAKDVGRYFFIMRSLDAPLDFDLELAKDESEQNPVFYLQYAHARVCSIFRETNAKVDINYMKTLSMTTERQRLLFWIARFSEEILDSAKNKEPHRLANYLQNLSKAFTKFYLSKDNRIKDTEVSVQSGLATICELVKIVLSQGLNILGISAPEKM